ncbi:hypothetical protein K9L04_01790, partial [Patescibacteria group bacterium]|nr:hypothetical protein [Patescibacteria group bacterium]
TAESNIQEDKTITENLADEENDDIAGENDVLPAIDEDNESNEENSYDLSDEEINNLLEEENLDEIANQIEQELNQTQKED